MTVVDVVFEPGQPILHRMFTGDALVLVRSAIVVGDDERGLRLWIPHGGPIAIRMSQDGRGIRDMPFAEWVRQPTELTTTGWHGPNIFMLIPPRQAHSVWWFWDARSAFAAWYVNLEEPVTRWRDGDSALAGVDGCDHDLDIWVYPDRNWEWKDEDELDERLAFPEHYWVSDAAAVRAEGEKVVGRVEEGRFPFDGTWCDFRPEPSWQTPTALPAGWDRPRIRRTGT
nr:MULTISPECIES: DUF402 domain-containing protein [unclassified Frankia]